MAAFLTVCKTSVDFEDLHCQVAFTDLFNDEGRLEKELGLRLYNELLK